MSLAPRAPIVRLARPWLSALAAVALLLAALAGPAVANEGPTRLVDPSVSPRAGEPTTTITFSVTYRNREGSEPDYVRVAIDGTNHAMSPTSTSTNYKAGVRFAFATTLPVGEHAISFTAMDRDRFTAEAKGGKVTISEPSSDGSGSGSGGSSGGSGSGSGGSGAGTSTGTSGSDSGATTGSDSGATTGSDSGSGAGTSTSGSGAGDSGSSTGTSGAGAGTSTSGSDSGATTDSGSGTGGWDAGSTGGSDPPGGQNGSGTSAPAPGATAGPPAPPSGAGSGSASGPSGAIDGTIGVDPRDGHDVIPEAIAAGGTLDTATGGPIGPGPGPGRSRTGGPSASSTGLEILGVGASPFDRTFRAVPVMITTSGTAVAWAAFLMFGKKRRDSDPTAPDPVLAARAAAGMVTSSASLIPQPSVQPELPMGVDPNEAGMPRWRRPSLLEARKNDPLRNASVAMSLTFAHGSVGPVEGKERRRIRYRLVRLMDIPDEVRANEIGVLDEGDEVQLLEKSGTYWLVLCPDGRQGWLHKMVLGEVIDDEDAPLQLNPDGIDEDVLSAFLAIRDRTA